MTTFNGLPLYRVALASDGDGVLRVSLVDDPAVQSQFEYFKAEQKPVLFAVQDEEKRIVRGVVLRADYPIYRRDNDTDPGYYVTFGAGVIREAAEKLLAEGRANDINLMHEDGSDVEGVQMVQFFIKDSTKGISPEGFDDIADGSLFAEYHVTNDEVWDEIKAGTFRGFSVEILYHLIPAAEFKEQDLLDRLFNKIENKMSFAKFKKRLAALLGEPEKFGSVTTDKGVIVWDGDEDLKAGDRVQVEDADGNRTDAADGDYTTQDGKVIVVVDGSVSEIKDPEAEVSSDGAEDMKSAALSRIAKMEESYDEKQSKIAGAIRALRGNREDDYGYLVSAGDDFAVWVHYGEETGWEDKYERYRVSWDGDEPTVSDPVECRMAFVPMDFDDAAAFDGGSNDTQAEEQMEQAITAAERYKAEADTLRARVTELEAKPAAPNAHEQFNAPKAEKPVLDRLRKYMDKI